MTKKILITGKNSYIGRSFIEYCKKNEIDFEIDELDVRGEEWKSYDFTSYDSVFHVAGIAHMKETKKNKHLYYHVNRDLAVSVAQHAKSQGVKNFLFMSTMSVYGKVEGYINKYTQPDPINAYGLSKLQAEERILKISNDKFIVSIIRPPMIYGPGCKGNYSILSKFAKVTKIFPQLDNERSMLFIDNLNLFLIGLIRNPSQAYYFPQNKKYVSTKNLIREISRLANNNVFFTSKFNPILKRMKNNLVKKIFGDLKYDLNMSCYSWNYQYTTFNESIKITEEGSNESSNN